MTDTPQPVCIECGKSIPLHVRIEEDAVYLCDEPGCVQKRTGKNWKEAHAAREMRRAEEALDNEPEEESNVAVKPCGPYVGEKVIPGSAYDRKLERLKVPPHIRAQMTTDEARRLTPGMARAMTKEKSVAIKYGPNPEISSADKDPGIRTTRTRRPNLETWARDTLARRKAGIYDDLDEQDAELRFDEYAFGISKRGATPEGTDHIADAVGTRISTVHQDFGQPKQSYSVHKTDNGWRLDTPHWVKYKLDDFFRGRFRLADAHEDEETREKFLKPRVAIDREILLLYYREGLEDAEIYRDLKEEIERERGKQSKSPEEYIKKRRQRLLKAATDLPGFVTTRKKARAILFDYVYETPDGEATSRFGFTTYNLSTPASSLYPEARKRCKMLFDAQIVRFGDAIDRAFGSYELALAFMLENQMKAVESEN